MNEINKVFAVILAPMTLFCIMAFLMIASLLITAFLVLMRFMP